MHETWYLNVLRKSHTPQLLIRSAWRYWGAVGTIDKTKRAGMCFRTVQSAAWDNRENWFWGNSPLENGINSDSGSTTYHCVAWKQSEIHSTTLKINSCKQTTFHRGYTKYSTGHVQVGCLKYIMQKFNIENNALVTSGRLAQIQT